MSTDQLVNEDNTSMVTALNSLTDIHKEPSLLLYNYETEQSEQKLDSVKSGESIFKFLTFDTSKYNSNTEKCMAFWKTLNESDLKPVNCTLIKAQAEETKGSLSETETGPCEIAPKDLWTNALDVLRIRNMDKAAMAVRTKQCNLCIEDQYSPTDICCDNENIISLNTWDPNSKKSASTRSGDKIDSEHSLKSEPIEIKEVIPKSIEDLLNDLMNFEIPNGKEEEKKEIPTTIKELLQELINLGTKFEENELAESNVTPETAENLDFQKHKPEENTPSISSSEPSQMEEETPCPYSPKPGQVYPPDIITSSTTINYKCECGHVDCECNIETKQKRVYALEPESESIICSDEETCKNLPSSETCSCHKVHKTMVNATTETELEQEKQETEIIYRHCVVCGSPECLCLTEEKQTQINEADKQETSEFENEESFAELAKAMVNFAMEKYDIVSKPKSIVDNRKQSKKGCVHIDLPRRTSSEPSRTRASAPYSSTEMEILTKDLRSNWSTIRSALVNPDEIYHNFSVVKKERVKDGRKL